MKEILTNILILISLLMSALGFSQDLKKIELNKKMQVLNNKAFFCFPDEARNEERGTSIMSVPPNEEEETRIICDFGEKRLVFFAEELFKIGNDCLFEEISKGNKEILTYSQKVLTNEDSIYSILSTPTDPNEGKSGMLVNKLTVKVQDGTLFQIMAYISPEAYNEKEKYMEFSEKIFKTLSKGNRTTNLEARTENISLEMDHQYKIDLPANYSYVTDISYDFKVTRLYKYTNYNTERSRITFYSGSYPTSFAKKYKKPGIPTKGLFLKQEIEWYLYKNDESVLKEVIISYEDNKELHIAIQTDDKTDLEELTKIVESIKFIK